MGALIIITKLYFILGLLMMILTIFPENNFFIKRIVKLFYTPNDFNKFMLFYWLIPVIISTLFIIVYKLIN